MCVCVPSNRNTDGKRRTHNRSETLYSSIKRIDSHRARDRERERQNESEIEGRERMGCIQRVMNGWGGKHLCVCVCCVLEEKGGKSKTIELETERIAEWNESKVIDFFFFVEGNYFLNV